MVEKKTYSDSQSGQSLLKVDRSDMDKSKIINSNAWPKLGNHPLFIVIIESK